MSSYPVARSTPTSIPDCAVPLLFETGLDDVPYAHAGTGFLAVLDEKLFFVTADHCIRPEQHNQLRLPISVRTTKVARLKNYFSKVVDRASNDAKDIAFFTVEDDADVQQWLYPRAVHLPVSFDFEAIRDKLQAAGVGIPLIVKGFPLRGTETAIDYDAQKFVAQGVTILADFRRTWDDAPDLHAIQAREPCPIDDLNGMSGSPVFGVTKHPVGDERVYFLLGMLVMGVFPNAHFVSIRTIRAAMVQALLQETQTTTNRNPSD